jgi:hypothetical protein
MDMRLFALIVTAILTTASAHAQPPVASSAAESPSATQDATQVPGDANREPDTPNREPGTGSPEAVPFSLDRIREALQTTPVVSLRTLDERPTFRVQIRERQKIEELLATLNFKTAPTPGGGLYGFEQQRQMFPAVDNPLRQPYAAFNQPELLTILVENLVGKYLAGRAVSAITSAERARAEAAAREEVHTAIGDYCAAQANGGAGVPLCSSPDR